MRPVPGASALRRAPARGLGCRREDVSHEAFQVAVGAEELAQGPPCRAEGVELGGGHSVLIVCPPEVLDPTQLLEIVLTHRGVDLFDDFVIGVLNDLLPGEGGEMTRSPPTSSAHW